MSKSSYIFYRSFYEAIKDLPDSDKLIIYDAITQYALDRTEPNLTGFPKTIFKLIQPQLDANWKRYENGLKGGAPEGNMNAVKTTDKQPKNNQKQTNENEKVNVNDKEIGGMGEKKTIAFSPPTLSELSDFIRSNNYAVSADEFLNFYQSKGWMVGKSRMKDWKAAVRTWHCKNKTDNPGQSQPASTYKPLNVQA